MEFGVSGIIGGLYVTRENRARVSGSSSSSRLEGVGRGLQCDRGSEVDLAQSLEVIGMAIIREVGLGVADGHCALCALWRRLEESPGLCLPSKDMRSSSLEGFAS